MEKIETVAGILERFTFREQQIICHAVRTHSQEQRYAHLTPALLPFIPVTVATGAMKMCTTTRPVAVIRAKLPSTLEHRVRLWLYPRKVVKVFGGDPSKGRRFNWLPEQRVGGKVVDRLVCLKFQRKPLANTAEYTVVVHRNYREAVVSWLCDNCT